DEHFHRYRLIEARSCDVPLEILLSCGRFDGGRHSGSNQVHNHKHTFSTWSYETDQPLSLEALRAVASRLPTSIYRCKGVIHSADAPDRRAVLQVVGKRVDLSLDTNWGARPPRTQIVAIGAHGALEGASLREKFDACIANDSIQIGKP
ncbi:MAG: GTP-binding protein, partial [Tepidisphaeraceae bacterium]